MNPGGAIAADILECPGRDARDKTLASLPRLPTDVYAAEFNGLEELRARAGSCSSWYRLPFRLLMLILGRAEKGPV
jgi:hypothetical protein